MSRRSYIRIISYVVFMMGIIIASGLISSKAMNSYKGELELSYQQSLIELNECLEKVDTDITKSLYSNSSGEIYDLSRDLYSQCTTAKNAMSRLPVEQMKLNNAYKFLSQCGDYAQYIGQKIDNKEQISDEEHNNLKVLLNYAEKFNNQAKELVSIVNNGGLITSNQVVSSDEINVSALSNSFSSGAETFEDFPTLLYDGPFSDQVLNRHSELVSNGEVFNKEQCREKIASALNMNIDDISYEDDDKSTIPCYTFNYGRYTIMITKQGGYIREIDYSGIITQSNITPDNACNIAETLLKNMGYSNMVSTYYTIEDNICTINCAYESNGVRCYSDLIKIGISMEDGELIKLDAKTYLVNHTERDYSTPALTEDEAQKYISNYLEVSDIKKAIIPKESGKEVECYEFTCKSLDTGENALVYINCDNGNEEDIMILLYTDNGTLTK